MKRLSFEEIAVHPASRSEQSTAPGLLDAVVEHHMSGILVVQHEGAILYANAVAKHMLCLDESDAGCQLFGHPLLLDETVEIDLFQADGTRGLAEMHTLSIPWRDGQAFMVSLQYSEDKIHLREQLL
ncbi:MAG: PAS domain-containing protein [Sulfuricella sp.]